MTSVYAPKYPRHTANWSSWLTVTTSDSTVPGVPTGLTLTPGLRQIGLEWVAPVNTGGTAITGYAIEYRIPGAADWSTHAHTGTDVEATITSLTAGQEYEIQVAAINGNGTGSFTDALRATAEGSPDAPAAPQFHIDITADPDTLTSMEMYWTEPDDNGSGITDYDLRYRIVGSGTWTDVTGEVDTLYDAASLTLHEEYEAQVRASNAHGTSDYSDSGTIFFSPRWLYITEQMGGYLWRWDEDSVTQVGTAANLGVSGFTNPTDLAALDNTLYLVSSSDSTLYRVDVSTGRAASVCSIPNSIATDQIWGLTGLAGVLYVNIGGTVYTLDEANCGTTLVGVTGHADLRGLAAAGGDLYGTRSISDWPGLRSQHRGRQHDSDWRLRLTIRECLWNDRQWIQLVRTWIQRIWIPPRSVPEKSDCWTGGRGLLGRP